MKPSSFIGNQGRRKETKTHMCFISFTIHQKINVEKNSWSANINNQIEVYRLSKKKQMNPSEKKEDRRLGHHDAQAQEEQSNIWGQS